MKAAPSHPLIDRAEEVRLSAASIEAVGSEFPRSQSEVEGRRLSWEREAASLFLAAWWEKEHERSDHNSRIVRRARMLAQEPLGIESQLLLVAAGEILSDLNLDVLLARMTAALSPDAAAMVADSLLQFTKQPITWNVGDEDESVPISTHRRAVPRVGRNDPCPCGSVKKYKRCCIDKDQERLRDPSDILGVTQAELRRELEDFLTLERIDRLRAHELVR